MEQYIIKYARTVELGGRMLQYAGPFPAHWMAVQFDNELRTWGRENKKHIPAGTYDVIYTPENKP